MNPVENETLLRPRLWRYATRRLDASRAEGIDPERYNGTLGLIARGFTALCVTTAGYRAADNKYGAAAKARFRPEDVIEHFTL